MRFPTVLLTSCFIFLFSCVSLSAKTSNELTGEQWVQMVQDEKNDFVEFVIQFYKDQGVAVNRPASFYVYTLDTTISSNSAYESKGVYGLLGELLRRNEPGVQAALHSSKTASEKIEMH